MATIWENKNTISYDTLSNDAEFDTIIIGGGIAGLWCAYNLVKAGQSVCILEAKRIGSGVTAGSTAILTHAQDIIFEPLIKKHGKKAAARYLHDTKSAIENIRNIIDIEQFDCDLESIDFVLFSTKTCGAKSLSKEYKAYRQLGQPVEIMQQTDLPYKTKAALKFKDCYQFNPVKLCNMLAQYITSNGGKIFENILISEHPQENRLKAGEYFLTAKNFIVATHFPYINVPGFYWLKMYQSQNYAIAYEIKNSDNFCRGISYESIDQTGFEYRRAGKLILCDGADVRTGQKPYHSKYQIIQKHINKHFNETREIVRYCAQDCITMDKLPYAGRYSHFADNVFVVTGFNKWGMTNSYICAQTVCNMILGKQDRNAAFEDNIYSPQRAALFVNLIETVSNVGVIAGSFIGNILNLDAKKFERIKAGQGAVIKFKGHRVGASRDNSGKVHLISAVCPHMGCNLKWNKDECTFDCPCHGSRFDILGNIINNPSTKRAKQIELPH